MSLDITHNLTGFDKLLDACKDGIQEELAERVAKDMEPYVPKDTGALRGTVKVSKDEIVYPMRYAAPVYDMPDGTHWTTAGTGGKWFEEAKSHHMNDWNGTVAEGIARQIRR